MKLVLATHNPGKVREIQAMLGSRFEIVSQASLNIGEAEEPHHTFVENALAKARHASRAGTCTSSTASPRSGRGRRSAGATRSG